MVSYSTQRVLPNRNCVDGRRQLNVIVVQHAAMLSGSSRLADQSSLICSMATDFSDPYFIFENIFEKNWNIIINTYTCRNYVIAVVGRWGFRLATS